MAEHDLSDPKGRIRGLMVIQKLNKKWCASKNGTMLVRNNVQAKLEKNMSEKPKLEAF